MSNLAIIAPIQVRPHPNADRLQLGVCLGYQVVVGLNVKSGDLGVFFPEGLQLSEAYATANNLIKNVVDGVNTGGMFEANRRVKCQKLRGEKSEGFWNELTSLSFAGDITKLKEGDQFDELGGAKICSKYITKATYAKSGGGKQRSQTQTETLMFRKHFDTAQLRFAYKSLPIGQRLVLTAKLHGTSQRTGLVYEPRVLNYWEKWAKWLGIKVEEREWVYLTGTRNCVITPAAGYKAFTLNESYRTFAESKFLNKLHKGETVYYEVVGWAGENSPIMGSVTTKGLKDKELTKRWGETVTYKYGCPQGTCDIYVYRVVVSTTDGRQVDLSWHDVKVRCQEIGVKHVPELTAPFLYDGDEVKLKTLVESYLEKEDVVDPSHPLEGVCVRVDSNLNLSVYKHKSFIFGLLEGYLKEKDDYVDTEESA